jgi:hypothetical protein
MGGAYGMHGRDEKCREILWKKKGNRPSGRPKRTWEDNIEMDLNK